MKVLRLLHITIVMTVLTAGGLVFYPVGGKAKDVASEERIKAAFVYRFTQYTKWPKPLGDTLYLCVYGDTEVTESVKEYAGRTVQGRKLEIIHLSNTVEQPKECHAVFVGSDDRTFLREISEFNGSKPVLLISDIPGALDENIDIALSTEPNRIAFSINLTQAKKRHFSFSGQMLKLARNIF